MEVAKAGSPAPDEPRADWSAGNQAFLAAALDVVAGRLAREDIAEPLALCERLRRGLAEPPALDAVAAAFGLSGFEREVLLLCAGVELDSRIARACAQAHGDPGRPFATFSLTMTALPD